MEIHNDFISIEYFENEAKFIDIIDNHNLSILISTSNHIYNKFSSNSSIIIQDDLIPYLSKSISCNKNYVLLSCYKEGYLLSFLNIRTGKIRINKGFKYYIEFRKSCPISIVGNSAYIFLPSKRSDSVSYQIFEFELNDIDNEENGPYVENNILGSSMPTISLSPISQDNQLSLETLSIFGESESYLIYIYVKPEKNNEIIIYNIYGGVNSNQNFIFSSTIETGVKLLKINSYTLRCIIQDKYRDIKLIKKENEIYIANCTDNYNTSKGIISYNEDLKISFYDNKIMIEKEGFLNYFLLTVPGVLNNTFEFYDKNNDSLIIYYQLVNSINYITVKNLSFYFNISSNSSMPSKKYVNNLTLSLNEYLMPQDNYGIMNLSNISYSGDSLIKYYFNESNNQLSFLNNPYIEEEVTFSFNYIYKNISNISVQLFFSPPIQQIIQFQNFPNFIHSIKEIIPNNNSSDINADNIIKTIREEINNDNLNGLLTHYIIKEQIDLSVKEDNILYQFTSSNIQNKNNKNYDYNISTIKFDECEMKLRSVNGIDNETKIIIFKVDIFKEDILIPIIEYEVFNFVTKDKLDLSPCKEMKMEINIPVKIKEEKLFQYNSSSEYYNDICYTYTSEFNTDIILKDRRNEYSDGKKAPCESNCEYYGYNIYTKKVICNCFIKIKLPFITEIEIDKDRFINSFIDLKNIFNIKVIKCYKMAFSKEGLIKNFGFYIITAIILITIILEILFIIKGFENLKLIINEIIASKINELSEDSTNKNVGLKLDDTSNSIKASKKTAKSFEKINRNNLNDYELNNLSYRDALIIDKRSYFQYYFSLLKLKHMLIFTFYTSTDYNSKIIKIILFFFCLSVYLTINTLFFDDLTIHKIYENKGVFDLVYQIPNILYSLIISSIINTIVNYLSLSQGLILILKNWKGNIIAKASRIMYILIIRIFSFFMLTFVFLLLFLFYLTCFCAVFKNSQVHLIKEIFTGFGLSLLYPLGIYLLPGIFRILALNSFNKDKEVLYKFSKILQLI